MFDTPYIGQEFIKAAHNLCLLLEGWEWDPEFPNLLAI